MDLKSLKGINEKRKSDFLRLGIVDVGGLIRHFPRSYLDLTRQQKLSECINNQSALVLCKVIGQPQIRGFAKGRTFVKVLCQSGSEPFYAVWFNQPYVKNYIKPDAEYFFYGRVENKFGAISMVNPVFENALQNDRLKGLVPVYKLSGNLTQKTVNNLILSALKVQPPKSAIPEFLQKKYALSPLDKAYFTVHNPSAEKMYFEGAKRIAVEEFFLLISAFKFLKGGKETARYYNYTAEKAQISDFLKKFPYTLTDGQKSALADIYNDLRSGIRMNRLLQGDVGSGKTAVALVAVFMAIKSGHQAAMIAPTEVLARQNYEILRSFFGDKVVYLTGSLTAAQKRIAKQKIASGEAAIACGTHAVLQDDVQFCSLALCICDEQHRFGVRQRSELAEKGAADMLVMSATPIPRTLSLIIYGDLDISEIKDKPQGRGSVKTVIVPPLKRQDMLSYIQNEIKKGRQAYIVAPRIEDDEEGTDISAQELFEEISKTFTGIKCALLHGRMKEAQKLSVMQDFKDGKIGCLISTTVIEVGIDVQNATIMAIFAAERFGLSQLHQLRGRIGRGELDSFCFLVVSEVGSDNAAERLKLFKSTNDGFEIAAFDYQMRGGGDFLGTRQSGKFFGEIKNLKYSQNEVVFAKKLAEEAFERPQDLINLRTLAEHKYQMLKDIVLN